MVSVPWGKVVLKVPQRGVFLQAKPGGMGFLPPQAGLYTHRPIGRYHNPQRRRRCRPLSEAIHTPPLAGGHNPRGAAPFTFLSEPSYNMFGRGRLEDLSLLDLSPLQHEHAFGIMVIGAIEDIPLNPV